nr:MAG TPA: Protein of unknown function (DUF3717) [Caudoviricetes sp.]
MQDLDKAINFCLNKKPKFFLLVHQGLIGT